ncbi:hypothetical protein J5N97_024679 [Dioscorea zingiberensis]|uniref:Uncharacterized protein n=1 Tax=Dioscorea zingiberensis TaxID=325984 RepID=A0A9D5C6V9_9LILI|nr:hypothetical protein J5N97_024679 [Dioscorea zingiberensis]
MNQLNLPDFPFIRIQPSNGNKGEHQELLHGRRSRSSSRDELHCLPETLEASHDELPPGFAPQLSETKPFIGVGEEDPDVPPGFGAFSWLGT